jgi:hypothetical protein
MTSQITYYAVNIEAESEEKAYELAIGLDGGDFVELNDCDWQIDDVCEADESMIEKYPLLKGE